MRKVAEFQLAELKLCTTAEKSPGQKRTPLCAKKHAGSESASNLTTLQQTPNPELLRTR
jgi:hypothetical protein